MTSIGTFCLVLHTHLPWLAHHGTWPVGEEWLHQAWSQAYLPVVDVLDRLAAEGHADLVTLGITPVLAAQLDDPYCLREHHTWLGLWQLRAEGLATRRERHLRDLAAYEFARARDALETFESRWSHGGTPVLRSLADAGVVQLLGGPATHAFQPLLHERVARFALDVGLDDHLLRFGRRPAGIWAPECAYRPGLEQLYARAGVGHFLVDGPTLMRASRPTSAAWRVGDTDVVAFGRDLDVTYRVWSPRRGYPGGAFYRDFHTYDHPSGFKPARVTSPGTPPEAKAPYDPASALVAVQADVTDFVATVRQRLARILAENGRPGVVVAAYDTELFGHWWHEGPVFLEGMLRALPAAGVQVTTLAGALAAGHASGRVDPEASSWGRGKDFSVWSGPAVLDLVDLGQQVQSDLLKTVDDVVGQRTQRRADLDALAHEALLTLASDWAFMVSHSSAVDYARERVWGHARAFAAVRDALRRGAAVASSPDRPFGHLDARLLAREG